MTTLEHAKAELKLIGYNPESKEEGINEWMFKAILELLEVFSKQGHSGASAPYAIGLFSKLASHENITPLTGNDDEWVWVSKGLWQNKRLSTVFKKQDGSAYDIEGRIFRTKTGSYTSSESCVPVVFPYTQKKEYVQTDED